MTCHNHQNCSPVKTLIATLFTFLFQTLSPTYASLPTVAITQIINHPALNQQRDGIIAALKEAGYTPDESVKIVTEDAQGNVGTAAQIATKFSALNPAVVVGISTPSAQALVLPMQKINVPLVFTAVTDPKSAKLTDAPDRITGVSCGVPVKIQLQLIRDVIPTVKTIGVVYNPGESNAAATVQQIQDEAKAMGLTVVVAGANKTSEVGQATLFLRYKVQALLLADDNTTAAAIDSVIGYTQDTKDPVFTSDSDLIKRGAVGGQAVDHFELGKQAGRQVVRILKGDKVSDIPIEAPKNIVLTGHKEMADFLGIKFPDTVKWVESIYKPKGKYDS